MPRISFVACALAVALVAGACDGRTGSSTTRPSTTSVPTSTSASARPATTAPGPAPTQTTVDDTVAAAIRAKIDDLILKAQQIRGLAFLEPVEVILLDDADYQVRIIELLAEELTEEEVDAQTAIFRLLGVIGPEADLRDTYDTLFSTGTGGFYDPDTNELVVRVDGEELGPQSASVVVHELTHALQDQHFGLLDSSEDLEGDLAYVATAVIEGDALLRELTYIENLETSERLAWAAEYSASLAEVEAIQADLPGYLVSSLQAPYLDGFFFHQRVGLDRVDDLFDDLPESSEQILDYDKYLDDEQPLPVDLPELELDGYETYLDSSMGQKDLELLLSEVIGQKQAEVAAAGWGGDRIRIYNRGRDDAVFVLAYRGDSTADAAELVAAFREYQEAMVPSDSFSLIESDGAEVLVVFASDNTLNSQLRTAFSG